MDKSKLQVELQRLYEIVGEENFIQIQKEYGGETIYIPKPNKERNENILYEFLYEGMSPKELAKKWGLSTSMINKIIKNQREEKNKKTREKY